MRNHVLRLLLILAIFISIAHTASATVNIKIEGTTYPIRMGQSDQNDTVTPYAVVGNPVCIKRGSTVTLSVEDSTNATTHWRIISVSLVSLTSNNTTYFSFTDQNTDGSFKPLHPVSEKVEVGSVPNKIEYAELRVNILTVVNAVVIPPGGVAKIKHKSLKQTHQLTQKLNYGAISLKYGASSAHGRRQSSGNTVNSEVFVVLDTPKAPMSPAWVGVLQKSCKWAAGETTEDGAAQKLTERFYQDGTYYGDGVLHTSTDGMTLYLKDFLDDMLFPRGQCTDFADFLVCLVNSVGAMNMKAQKCNPIDGPRKFRTRIVKAAGETSQHSNLWYFHQFAVSSNNVWDACIGIPSSGGYYSPVKKDRDTDYYNLLIDYYLQGYMWDPQTAGDVSVTAQPKP